MITTRYKSAFTFLTDPVARVLVQLGVAPTAITLAGLFLVFVSCLFLVMTHQILVFCLLVGAASVLDAIDGAVARGGGRVTKFGSYLDAVCDRYAEGVVVLAVAAVTGYWVLSGIVLWGALLVSYTKARAAMEVPVSNQEWPDLMERTERGVVFIVGLAASQVIPWRGGGHDLFWWTLVVLSILVHATAIQRVLRARRLIRQRHHATSW